VLEPVLLRLGGEDNFAADRAAVEAWLQIDPEVLFTARANRAFLGRAVRYLAAEAGIRQFLDIGTGIPTSGNTHQVAQAVAPESRVVYSDYDPVVLAHARALLSGSEPLTPRSREQVAQFFTGTELIEPGLVRVEEWRPEPSADESARSSLWCAVGRKI
jgi:hypothetical protein